VYSILSPEWNADKTRAIQGSLLTAVARLFRGNRFVQVESLREVDLWRRLDLVMRIPVTTY
jgi:hypothetical protein